MKDDIPSLPGSYAVRLLLSTEVRLEVGRLGAFTFPAGELVYLGSANGPGGLRARLRHHFVLASRPRWHLDYLRPHCVIVEVAYAARPGDALRLECLWSQALAGISGAAAPAPGFGSSDCRAGCPAHLIAFPGGVAADTFVAALDGVLRAAAGKQVSQTVRSIPLTDRSGENRVQWEHFERGGS